MGFYADRVFPVLNDLLSRSFARHRKRVLRDVSGRVLEIGFGSGLSLECYPSTQIRLFAIEPQSAMQERSSRVALPQHIQLQKIRGEAEALPFEDVSFDHAVSFLTLCSVTDLEKSISELHRVLKPGGRLHFIEHMQSGESPLLRSAQSLIQPAWKHLACGCHLNRPTLDALKLRFEVQETKVIGWNGFPNLFSPIVRGVMVRK